MAAIHRSMAMQLAVPRHTSRASIIIINTATFDIRHRCVHGAATPIRTIATRRSRSAISIAHSWCLWCLCYWQFLRLLWRSCIKSSGSRTTTTRSTTPSSLGSNRPHRFRIESGNWSIKWVACRRRLQHSHKNCKSWPMQRFLMTKACTSATHQRQSAMT